jgi:hypothetical protein
VVSPDIVIPVRESNGLICPPGAFVFGAAA